MNARWINAVIATCAITGRAAHRVYGKVTFLMYDRFLIPPRGRRNATRRAPKRVSRNVALHRLSRLWSF